MAAKILCQTGKMTDQEWREVRKQGIGGSDAAVVCGLNPWKSAYALWLEKTGQVEEQDLSDNEKVFWGNALEDKIAEVFAERTGLKLWRQNAILQHPDYPFMFANIDRRVVGKNEGLEIKTTGEFNGKLWADDKIPDMYFLQCQHYLAVTGADKWHLAVLIGGQRLLIREVFRDTEIIASLIQREVAFWDCVTTGKIPELDGSESGADAIAQQFPESNSLIVDLPKEAENWITVFETAGEQISELEKVQGKAKAELQMLLRENEAGRIGQNLVIWKTQAGARRLDGKRLKEEMPALYEDYLKEGESTRKFTIKKLKEGNKNG